MPQKLFLDPHSTMQRSDTYYVSLEEELESWFYSDEVQSIRAGNTDNIFDVSVQKPARPAASEVSPENATGGAEQTLSYDAYMRLYYDVCSRLYPQGRPERRELASPIHAPWPVKASSQLEDRSHLARGRSDWGPREASTNELKSSWDGKLPVSMALKRNANLNQYEYRSLL